MIKIKGKLSELKKYFRLLCIKNEIKKSELLSSNEALKRFGQLWIESRTDVLMMMTVLEYDFISQGVYTEGELRAVKATLGKVATFIRECSEEWEEFEREQEKKEKDH